MNKKKSNQIYVLSSKKIILLTVYYVVVVLASLTTLLWIMAISSKIASERILFCTGVSSIAAASMLCCVQYLKRLYKACIDLRINEPETASDLRQLGSVLYFMLRPLYAAVFAVLAIFALLAGVIMVTAVDFELNSRFLYLCVIVSGIIGFSVGQVLDAFGSISEMRIKNISMETGGKNDAD